MAESTKKAISSVSFSGLVAGSHLTVEDFAAIKTLSQFAHELTGVQLSERHRAMVAARLNKRLIELGLSSLQEYVVYFQEHREQEAPKFIGLVTTHHTYFFREFAHFEYLKDTVVPALLEDLRKRPDRKLKIWAAACSRGQEVYSLAMFLDFYLKQVDPSLQFEIYATDVDPESVAIAKNGVYLRSELKEVPLSMMGNHWVRGTGEIEAYMKAKKSLRDRCRFDVSNLLELSSSTKLVEKFDLIFCRNVFIYFNPEQIKAISQQLLARMQPKGYFFIGISESLSGLKLPLVSTSPSVYRHEAAVSVASTASAPAAPQRGVSAATKPAPVAAPTGPIRVLCVDDSPSILTLLKQILNAASGFEIVGVAKNGIEAQKQVALLKPDVLTLDIHMPEQTGIEYLQKNYRAGHPPVVMVTSVSRENADLAGAALRAGAADYVEKPALTNLAEAAEEIRTKVRCAVAAAAVGSRSSLDAERAFEKRQQVLKPESKLRVMVAPLSSRPSLKRVLNALKGPQPPIVLFLEGAKEVLLEVAKVLSADLGRTVSYEAELPESLGVDRVYLMDFATHASRLWDVYGLSRRTSVLVFGDVSKKTADVLRRYTQAQVVLEDLGSGKGAKALMDVASDVVLPTSFAYLSDDFLAVEGSQAGVGPKRKAS